MPTYRLFPTLAPLPPRFGAVLAGLGLTALLTLAPSVRPGAFPGDAALPYAPVTLNLHHQVHTRGLFSYVADDLHNLPYRTDRTVVDGIPLDALASWPFTAALGFQHGMWAYALALLWAAGAAGAWLGARWWGTARAALVTGVGWQTTEVVLRELAEGRSTQVFAAAWLPLCLGLGVLAATTASRRPAVAVAAGVCAALATIGSWDFVLFALPLALAPALLRREGAVAATVLASFATLLLPIVGWVWSGISQLPSASSPPWVPAPLDGALHRPADLAAARIYGLDGVALHTLVRPALLALAAWSAWKARGAALPGRWWPLVVGALGLVAGLGYWLPGPVVAPWGFLSMVKGFMRFWWADRAWLLPGLALALLAGGAFAAAASSSTRGLRAALPVLAFVALLLVESRLASPSLPLPALALAPSDAARALSASDQPFLLLPLGGGAFRADRLDLLDQVTHGRAMVGGTRYPFDITASRGLSRAWGENPTLRAIGECEKHPNAPAPAADTTGAPLVDAGIREVLVDRHYLDVHDGAAYAACVSATLAGWTVTRDARFTRYTAPAKLGRIRTTAPLPGMQPDKPRE